MKKEIERILTVLIGVRMSCTTRAANMECLKFGYQSVIDRGDCYNIGEFGLHVQCPWRITNSNEILIASNDLYEPADEKEFDEDFNWDEAGKNLRDIKLSSLFTNELIIESVKADVFGGFSLLFTNRLTLSTFPACSKKDDYSEHWRFLDNRPTMKQHIVVSNQGVDFQNG